MSPLPFDQSRYGSTLAHVGPSDTIPGWPGPVLRRSIPGSERHDLAGVWPYASTPATDAEARKAWGAMQASGAVTFQALARPDLPVRLAPLQAAGFGVVPLKTHYIRRPEGPPPVVSARSRANLARARRHWTVEAAPVASHLDLLCRWHEALRVQRRLTGVVALPAAHFAALATLTGFTALWAGDAAGPGACLIVAETAASVHFHTIAGDPRAYRTGAFYALYAAAVERWAARTLCFGGAPGGDAGAGIARFKSRFANDTVAVHLVTAVLDPAVCAALSGGRKPSGWFPPYRAPLS